VVWLTSPFGACPVRAARAGRCPRGPSPRGPFVPAGLERPSGMTRVPVRALTLRQIARRLDVARRPVASRRLLFCYLAHYNIVIRCAAVWKLPLRVLGDMTGSGAWSEDRMTKRCSAVVASGMSGPRLPCSIQVAGTNYLE
jgi:hypothetical protein